MSRPPSPDQPAEFRKKDGSLSKMRSHGGNVPVLPQNKLCPHCPAKFTRTTHLNRHLRTHTNERLHRCDNCTAEFTRSDLLTRHRKTCTAQNGQVRRRSCIQCSESKIKCDRATPCAKCISRGKECVYATVTKRNSIRNQILPLSSSQEVSSTTSASPFQSSTLSDSSFGYNSTIASNSSSVSASGPTDGDLASTSDTATVTEVETSVHSHLSSLYSNDMFEPFFSSLFSPSASAPAIPSEPLSQASLSDELFFLKPPEYRFLNEIDVYGQTFSSIFAQPVSEINYILQSCLSAVSNGGDPLPNELQHYLYLFFTAFLEQMPLVHFPTFNIEGKPAVLLNAMRACGALFVKTPKASNFVSNVLATAREVLVHEFAKKPTDSLEVVHLILAVVLLQTIGLFHQRPNQRAFSNIYHGMLVMMIRRTGLIQKNASWISAGLTETSLDTLWMDWAMNEMTKRALLLSFLHDTCQVIYFALPPSYNTAEILLHLPCEEALWRASSAEEWLRILQTPSPYGSFTVRLSGHSMPRTIASMSAARQLPVGFVSLTPFAHFVLAHAILRQLFTVCVESRLPVSMRTTSISHNSIEQEVFGIQFCLHAWLASWRNSPDVPKVNPNEEPTFFDNALPFYWLAQVSLLAYQEGLPPFEPNLPLQADERFKLIKHWLKQIRNFLKRSDEAPTLFWDELMKIRLQAWQSEMVGSLPEDHEGLLGFFQTQ